MAKLTDRAMKFAQRYVKDKPVEDNRTVDEKLASFHKEFEPRSLKEARKRVKSAKGRANAN